MKASAVVTFVAVVFSALAAVRPAPAGDRRDRAARRRATGQGMDSPGPDDETARPVRGHDKEEAMGWTRTAVALLALA